MLNEVKSRLAGKRLTFLAALLTVTFLFVGAQAYEKKETKVQQKQQVMEMMKNSSMVNMMMDRIASNKNMRMMMLDKMMARVEKDSTSMMEMCKKMMSNKDMHSMMMKMSKTHSGMMGGGMMDHEMMNHGKMQKRSADTTMTDHEAHHQKKN